MTAQAQREITLEDARQMLLAIPSDDRALWVQMGMAVKAEFGDSAFGIWDAWSQGSDKYSRKDAAAVWRSIKPTAPSGNTPTIASLVYQAKAHGWRPDAPVQPVRAPRKPVAPPKAAPSTKTYALELWMACDRSNEAVRSHPYAQKKGIDWHAGAGRVQASGRVVGRDADCIVVPIRENATGRVQGVQVINPEGAKQTFGSLSGGALLLGNDLDKRIPWSVVEGWADAVTFAFHWHHGHAVGICAFGKSRMDDVARMIDEIYRPREVLVIHDAEVS